MDILLEKSKENKTVAVYAAKEGLYNVATSRLYYSLYQKIIHILPSEKYEFARNQQGDSHANTIKIFFLIYEQDCIQRMNLIRDMSDLRKMRNKADYQSENITKEAFEKKVEQKVARLEKEIDKLI